MFEELLTFAILAEIGLVDSSSYIDKLDDYFIKLPENEALLELEFLYFNTTDAINTIQNPEKGVPINSVFFGKVLFKKLEEIYLTEQLSISEFGQKMYLLWNLFIPHPISQEEPFHILSYADDCLSYGDEDQTRKLYERAFDFYR